MPSVAHADGQLRIVAVQTAHYHIDPIGALVPVVRRGELGGHIVVGVQIGVVEIPLVIEQIVIQHRIHELLAHRLRRHIEEKPFLLPVPIDMHQSLQRTAALTGAYQLNAKEDIGHFMIEDAKIIIDEAGIEYNNRNYKTFSQEAIYFYKYHRHYKTSVDIFSQSYEDMDVTLRRLAQNFYVVRRSLVPFCVVARRIRRKVGVDEHTKQIMDLYAMGVPIIDTRRIFAPSLWKLFNSYSRKELPQKDWPVW